MNISIKDKNGIWSDVVFTLNEKVIEGVKPIAYKSKDAKEIESKYQLILDISKETYDELKEKIQE